MGPQIITNLANPLIALMVRSLPPHKTIKDWRGTLGGLCAWGVYYYQNNHKQKYTQEGIKLKKWYGSNGWTQIWVHCKHPE